MFIPLFCPHDGCVYHHRPPEGARWYVKRGYYQTDAFGAVQRFSCTACRKGFSEQTFKLDYYVKQPLSYQRVLEDLTSGSGVRACGRHLHVSHQAIINRRSRLARQALAVHAELMKNITMREHLAADGFESFVGSQYHPNNIHLLVGTRSLMLYSFDYADLRRKGRMTEYQKAERERREATLFRNRITIYKSFQRIADDIERLLCTSDTSPIFLFTDLRQEYPRALLSSPYLHEKIEKQELICTRISSKLPRTGGNPLFPVNYMDRQVRKNSANHVRETVQYSRNTNNCLEHLALFQLEHNYQKTFRVKEETKQDNRLHAEVAGIPSSNIAMELATLYSLRRFVTRIKLTFSQALVWFRMVGTIDRWDGGYAPHYVWM